MASLPPQHPVSQRRVTPPAELSSQPGHQRTDSFSAQSVDSQTLLLNSPHPQETKPKDTEPKEEVPEKVSLQEDWEPRRCWICFNDETEDDETTSEWRSPCTCSLVAHERCLLDWIADLEAPNSRRRAGKRASKVQCPQCKSEIRIQRPRSVVVEAVRSIERLANSLVVPGLVIITASAAYSTLTLAGTHTIYQIFGTEDALHILGPLYELPDQRITSPVARILAHLREHWRLDIGLPLIPTVLVASRTTFADSFLPFLPLIFFVSSGQPGDELLQLQWPPSAAFSFAALPYIRGFYNAFYERVCLPREQQWLKEIQPRADEVADAQIQVEEVEHDHDHDHDHDHNDEEINEVEIAVELDLFANWNNNDHVDDHDANAGDINRPARAPAINNDNEMPGLVELDQLAPAAAVPARPRVRRERNLISAVSVADSILGSLIFPSIAAAMGELLHRTLPSSWVTPPKGTVATSWLGGWIATGGKLGSKGRPTGFLQTRWGRTFVGGCLFVGLKDMILLYVRWRVAQNHRQRRILDCDPKMRKRGTTSTG